MFKIVEFSHLLISEYIKNSNLDFIRALDATCGNGFDTIYISNLLENKGSVDAYDIQLEAINHTKKLLEENNISNVTLIHNSHEYIDATKYDLAIFNLGYLPTYDKTITLLNSVNGSAVSSKLRNVRARNTVSYCPTARRFTA